LLPDPYTVADHWEPGTLAAITLPFDNARAEIYVVSKNGSRIHDHTTMVDEI